MSTYWKGNATSFRLLKWNSRQNATYAFIIISSSSSSSSSSSILHV